MRKDQSGVMLLEAMIAILIFSLGILGVVGMQAAAITASADAKYRTDAAMFANDIIGQMMASDRRIDISGGGAPQLKTDFSGTITTDCSSSTTPFCVWRNRIAAPGSLPGAAANPPFITVTAGAIDLPALTNIQPDTVSVTVQWQGPKDAVAHHYTVTTLIAQTN